MLKNLVILGISCLVSVFLAETAARLVFDPVDYLAVETVPDPVLNHRIAPGASGHDDWGYRNKGIPASAEVLAIGDSMTYGIMAKSYEAWPAQLQKITGKTTYNAALGGYGPLHYLHILKTRAPELSPKQVIVMIYPGNDLMDTYNLAYSNDYWSDYRAEANTEELDSGLFLPTPRRESLVRRLRNWLAQNSVLYRLLTQTSLFDGVRQRENLDSSTTNFSFDHLGTTVVLDPVRRLGFANVEDPRIREAIGMTGRVIAEMADYAAGNGIELGVALMPVREHVFFGLIGDGLDGADARAMRELNDSLLRIEAALTDAVEKAGVPYLNLRPVMQSALKDANIYPPTDGHPNALGYGIVAKALAAEFP